MGQRDTTRNKKRVYLRGERLLLTNGERVTFLETKGETVRIIGANGMIRNEFKTKFDPEIK